MAERIKQVICEFNIEPKEITQEIKKLGENIDLGEKATSGIFMDQMRYSFRINKLPLSFQFSIAYKFLCNEEEILITQFAYTIGNPPVEPRKSNNDE